MAFRIIATVGLTAWGVFAASVLVNTTEIPGVEVVAMGTIFACVWCMAMIAIWKFP